MPNTLPLLTAGPRDWGSESGNLQSGAHGRFCCHTVWETRPNSRRYQMRLKNHPHARKRCMLNAATCCTCIRAAPAALHHARSQLSATAHTQRNQHPPAHLLRRYLSRACRGPEISSGRIDRRGLPLSGSARSELASASSAGRLVRLLSDRSSRVSLVRRPTPGKRDAILLLRACAAAGRLLRWLLCLHDVVGLQSA